MAFEIVEADHVAGHYFALSFCVGSQWQVQAKITNVCCFDSTRDVSLKMASPAGALAMVKVMVIREWTDASLKLGGSNVRIRRAWFGVI